MGTYSLTGVDEAGSELQLHPDGRYVWHVSLGQVNRASEGRWARDGGAIRLTPEAPGNPSGIARADPVRAWSDEAERLYLRANFEAGWSAAIARCPFFGMRYPAYQPLATDPARDWADEVKAAVAAVANLRAAGIAAVSRWDRAKAAPEAAAAFTAAATALLAYEAAVWRMQDLHSKAGLTAPAYEAVTLPSRCALPRPLAAHEPLPAARHPQIGILVGGGPVGFVGAKLEVQFSDGLRVPAEAGSGGWAMLPVRPGVRIVAVGITIDDDEQAERVTLPVEMSGAGVLSISLDPAGFAARRLEPAVLTPGPDGGLTAQAPARGTYRKLVATAQIR